MASPRNALIAAVVWPALAWPALAAGPALNRIEPPAGRQGSEIEVTISGVDLDEPRELFFEAGRIAVAGLATVKENVVTATLSIPGDCPLGPHRLRLRTADGLSDLRMFHVHGSEQAAEKEPNNDAGAAGAVMPGTAVWGSLGGEDVDVYAVSVPAGGRIAAVVEGVALDQQMLDLNLELVDAGGGIVAACDDHPLLAQDAALAATVETAGTYYLRIREVGQTPGAGAGVYLLHVGDFPIAHVAWPPGGAAGKTVDVDWLGDPAGRFAGQAALDAPGLDGVCRVRPVRDGVRSPVAVPLRVTAAPILVESDGGAAPEQAQQAAAPCGIAGRIDAGADVDWFRVAAPKGSKWKVTGWGRRLGAPVDLVVDVHRDDAQRQRIGGNDDTGGPDSMLQVTVPDEGVFLLRVTDFQRRGGPEFVYWIDVEPVLPTATVSVPPAQTKTQQRLVAAVPRGGRTALCVNVARTDCTDPLRLEFAGLPPGVTALAGAIEQPAPGGLVVFEAAPDAAPVTTLADIRVLRNAEDAAAVGGLLQATELVHGEPNREPYRTALGDRLAVAVVDEPAFGLDVEPPAAPITRRGQVELAVRVRRAAGFTGKIRLELPFKPPGIAAATIDVDDGQTEVRFPLTAAADAPAREWRIAVAGTPVPQPPAPGAKPVRAGRGSWISTLSVPLVVIEPLVEFGAEKGQVEQGGRTTLVFKATKPATFAGRARVTLVGLPVKVEAPAVEFEAGREAIEVPLTVAADAPLGRHDGIFCRIEVPRGEAWVVHQSAATSLRIDKPSPTRQEPPAGAAGKDGGS